MTTKNIAIFTGAGFAALVSLLTVVIIFGKQSMNHSVAQCNKGIRGACIELLDYQSTWADVTSEYGQALIEHHYRNSSGAN